MDAIYQEMEDWLVQTPYPPRAWTGPPLPLAATAEMERALAQAEFDAEQTYARPRKTMTLVERRHILVRAA